MAIAWTAILALASSFPSATPPQKISDALLDMRVLGTIIEAYQNEFGNYPAPEQSLRPLSKVLKTEPGGYGTHAPGNDPWGRPYLYRANRWSYQVVSLGADGAPDHEYGTTLTGIGTFAPIRDTDSEEGDLVFSDGRFVQRPFGEREAAFLTINMINVIFRAAAEFAIDNNRYPGDSMTFVPVSELAIELVPNYLDELPAQDAWGRPLLYSSDGGRFFLASFGADGEQDQAYYLDLPCGLFSFNMAPSAEDSADIVQACGQFIALPTGTER